MCAALCFLVWCLVPMTLFAEQEDDVRAILKEAKALLRQHTRSEFDGVFTLIVAPPMVSEQEELVLEVKDGKTSLRPPKPGEQPDCGPETSPLVVFGFVFTNELDLPQCVSGPESRKE